MKLLSKKRHNELESALELNQYRRDLEGFTLLRDKAMTESERQRYTDIIEIMQKVVERLLGREV